MQNEKYAIYCYSLHETKFAPVSFDKKSEQTLGDLFILGAWINNLIMQKGSLPEKFSLPPGDFKPKLFSYYDFSEINKDEKVKKVKDNILVVLMPGFSEDIKLLEMVLGQRYGSHIKNNNISVLEQQHEILELKPNISGVGVDLKALWKKLFP